jgi:hypothetical protein
MLSVRDTEALAKTLAASGLEPSKAIPIFMGAKILCLFGLPALVWLGAVLLGYPIGKQALFAGLSLVVAMMLPNLFGDWMKVLLEKSLLLKYRHGWSFLP